MSDEIQWTRERPADGDMRPRLVRYVETGRQWRATAMKWGDEGWSGYEFEVLPPLGAPTRPKKRIRIALGVDSDENHFARSLYNEADIYAPGGRLGPISRTFVIEVEVEVPRIEEIKPISVDEVEP